MRNRMAKRRWLLALALAVVAGLTACLWWERGHQAPPQIITLPDGRRLRLRGCDIQQEERAAHIRRPPRQLAAGSLWQKWPNGLWGTAFRNQTRARRLQPRSSLSGSSGWEPTRLPPSFPPPAQRLADQSGVEAGVSGYAAGFFGGGFGVTWNYALFPVIPGEAACCR